VVFITNIIWFVYNEIIGIGIQRENHRKFRNTRSNGKQMVHILTNLLLKNFVGSPQRCNQ